MIKIIILVAGCWVLYEKIFRNSDVDKMWASVTDSLSSWYSLSLMLLSLLLMPINISLEAIKWRKSVLPVEHISFKNAFVAVFTGIMSGMLFPNRTGDFLGRVFVLERASRVKAAMLTFVGNIAQMVVTTTLGFIALIIIYAKDNVILFSLIAATIVTLELLLFFNIHVIKYLQIIIPSRWKKHTEKYVSIFSCFSHKDLFIILMTALAKYLVYSFQFVLLIWAFDVPLSYFNAMIPIMLTYLLMTIIPFITITEIAVRGSVCLFVFEKWLNLLNINASFSMMVFSASTLLWIFNLAIPAVIGLFFIHRMKFVRKSYVS
ncbi:MAG: hypothetical protein ACI358_08415 [Candidatus Limimorpha sp.]